MEIPVIASGGVGNLDHLVDGVLLGGADAVLAASIFHFGEYTVPQAKAYMAQHELPTCRHYFDPTKVHDGRECGLHTAA